MVYGKIALITGVLGQDGTYLADLLIKKIIKLWECQRIF